MRRSGDDEGSLDDRKRGALLSEALTNHTAEGLET